MVKTHEISLIAEEFEAFKNTDCIILEVTNINVLDYILFTEIDSELYRMTQVKEVIHNDGLKDGYALVIVNRL